MISRGLLRGFQEAGGRILTGTLPMEISKEDSLWKVRTSQGIHTSDSIISTIPVGSYVSLLGEIMAEKVHQGAGELRFRGLVFLSVLLNGEVPHGDHWIYTSEDRYPFNRLSISRNFDPGSPSQVIFEFSCQEGDELWNAPMERLLEQTVPGAEHLGLFTRGMIRGASIHREPEAYPIYDLNYGRASRTVLDALELLEGSVTCGRQGLFRYNNMDHSIEMGRCAALETLGEGSVRENFDWSPNTWADG
jgi:protoporphyrinogen oxidase